MRRAAEIEIDMHWNNGWHAGGGWLVMIAVMVAFWGGIAWVVMRLIRSGGGNRSISEPAPPSAPTDPEDTLHNRLASGEIDLDDYHDRLNAIRAKRSRS
jgi:putative membrane protein